MQHRRRLPRRGEHPPDEIAASRGSVHDVAQIVARPPRLRADRERELGRAEDRPEHVVEILRDATRERAERLELAGPHELLLHARPFGQIARESEDDLAPVPLPQRQARLDRQLGAVAPKEPLGERERADLSQRRDEAAAVALATHAPEVVHALADQLAALPAERALGRRVGVEDGAAEIGHGDVVVARLEEPDHVAPPLVRASLGAQAPERAADVAGEGEHALSRSGREVGRRARADVERADDAVLIAQRHDADGEQPVARPARDAELGEEIVVPDEDALARQHEARVGGVGLEARHLGDHGGRQPAVHDEVEPAGRVVEEVDAARVDTVESEQRVGDVVERLREARGSREPHRELRQQAKLAHRVGRVRASVRVGGGL